MGGVQGKGEVQADEHMAYPLDALAAMATQ